MTYQSITIIAEIKLSEQWLEWLRAYEKEIEEYIAELKEKE